MNEQEQLVKVEENNKEFSWETGRQRCVLQLSSRTLWCGQRVQRVWGCTAQGRRNRRWKQNFRNKNQTGKITTCAQITCAAARGVTEHGEGHLSLSTPPQSVFYSSGQGDSVAVTTTRAVRNGWDTRVGPALCFQHRGCHKSLFCFMS